MSNSRSKQPVQQKNVKVKKPSNRINVKCSKCGKPMSFVGSAPENVICSQCKEQAAREIERAKQAEINSRIHKKCKYCGKAFYIKKEKFDKLKELGLEPFAICYECSQFKKNFLAEGKKEQ